MNSKSPQCTLTKLDLFTPPMMQLSIEDKIYTEILLIAAFTNANPIEFFFAGDGGKYLDLNDTLPHLKVKNTNADGSNKNDEMDTGLVNYPLNTIIPFGIDLFLKPSAMQPYRAKIETLVNFSDATLKSKYSAGLFYKDTAKVIGCFDMGEGPSWGFKKRAAHTVESNKVHLFAPIHADIFFCKRLLLNSVDLRAELTRASKAFCLIGQRNSTFRLRILGASLFEKIV